MRSIILCCIVLFTLVLSACSSNGVILIKKTSGSTVNGTEINQSILLILDNDSIIRSWNHTWTPLITLNETMRVNDSILATRIDSLTTTIGNLGDSTGGWINTSDSTSTGLFVNVSKNLTSSSGFYWVDKSSGSSLSWEGGALVVEI